MVTKQEQLEWLAGKWCEWAHSISQVFMSKHVVGSFVSMTNDSHIILKEEWQKERDKLTSKQTDEPQTEQETTEFQKWCKSILSFVQAGAEGKEIEYKNYGTEFWYTFNDADYDCISFTTKEEYRIKPKIIKVNGFDVPAPIESTLPEIYYMPCLSSIGLYTWSNTEGGTVDNICWRRGICHSTKEAAIAHAKALLGIDPNKEDI